MTSAEYTKYVYTDSGVDLGGRDANSGGVYDWFGWAGPSSWTITFPTAIENVLAIDLTTMENVTISNGTLKFDGKLRLFAYNEVDQLVGSRSSATVNRSSTVGIASFGVLQLNGVTVKKIQVVGPSNSGPNLKFLGVVKGVTTFTIVTETDEIPGTIQLKSLGSTFLSCEVKGDPNVNYEVVVDNQTVDDVKSGDTVNVSGLQPNKSYVCALYKSY